VRRLLNRNPIRIGRCSYRIVATLGIAALACCTVAKGQSSDSSIILKIEGTVEKPLSLTLPDLKSMPHQTLKVTNPHTHQEEVYDGVPLIDLLKLAGIPSGENLRGAAMATFIIAEASDGYRVAFSLAELDPGIGDAGVLVADSLSGKPLDAKLGPLRLVVPRDKRPARWVRMLTALHVATVPKAEKQTTKR